MIYGKQYSKQYNIQSTHAFTSSARPISKVQHCPWMRTDEDIQSQEA